MIPRPNITWAQHTDLVANGGHGFPVVEVIWEDANSFGAPEWVEEIITNMCTVTTVGYLVHEDERVYVVVSLINEEHIGHGLVVPKSSVKGDIRLLR